jgi:hypothetical protein
LTAIGHFRRFSEGCGLVDVRFAPCRNRVERFFNRIKQCRRVATRYDELAANYLAFVQLASIRLWLRVNESASWSVMTFLRIVIPLYLFV